jgi:glycosyltransferase involved in cell wall biosynthesis
VKLLVVAQNYPHAGNPIAATFNVRSVMALQELCEELEVLVPRPYAPPLLSALVPRWRLYARIPAYERRENVSVYRPAYPQFPRVASAFWVDQAAFWWCRGVARRMHERAHFDAILAFDVVGVGGVAWRMGRLLGVPAGGWVTGNTPLPAFRRTMARALRNLDIVFYQSRDLLDKAALLLGRDTNGLRPERHVVLSRGISPPPPLDRADIRRRLRQEWGIPDSHTLVLSIGRIDRAKGVFELVRAIGEAAARNPRLHGVLVGANPAFDDTRALEQVMAETPEVARHTRILPVCPPERVWEHLCAADIFAFTSHREGMPNSLLEAMAMGVPAVAYAIPPVLEVDAGTGALLLVPPRDAGALAAALVRLMESPAERARLGELGRGQVMARFMVQKNSAIALDRLASVVSERNGKVRTSGTERDG